LLSKADLVTPYGPQATTGFTCLVLIPFEHEPSKLGCRKTNKKNAEKITEISASLAFLTLPMEQG
jgi:hypothetical protein